MSRFNGGNWVRYSGPQHPFDQMLGQVIGHYSTGLHSSLVMVRFLDGREYGCYPEFLTKVYQRTAAVEVAKLALS